jgi:plasmid replication initiation protein
MVKPIQIYGQTYTNLWFTYTRLDNVSNTVTIMCMENKNSHGQLVVKSNALVNAMFDLSLQGNRFLAFAISLLDRAQTVEIGKHVELEIPVLEFAETFDIASNNAYKEIEKLADQFQRKIITLQPDQTLDGRRVKVGLISKQKYHDGEGRVWIRFDEDLVPHLLGLKAQFTQYRIKDVYQFKSSHSWRLYELLKQYKQIGKRELEIDELKRKMYIDEKYSFIGNLKQRVVDPAVKEINETSDIIVDYSQKKRGRKIVSFIFIIRDNESTKTKQEKIRESLDKLDKGPCLSPLLEDTLTKDYSVSAKQAKKLANIGNRDEQRVLNLLPKLRQRWEKIEGKKVNLGGYVFEALKKELLFKNSFVD